MSVSNLSAKASVQAMLAAGAVFIAGPRSNGIGISYSYQVAPGGDADGCRSIMVSIKSRPAAFKLAFACEVAAAVGTGGAA